MKESSPLKILFASSEAFPLIKTGGLADVSGSLPRALQNLGHDVRLVLPGYQVVMSACKRRRLLSFEQEGHEVTLWQTTLPGSRVTVWLVDCAEFFDRPGNPYLDAQGEPWHDNAQRFALFCRVVARLAMDQFGLGWQPDVVHCNDWQTGLVPVALRHEPGRPALLFTVHNLAYQGLFSRQLFTELRLDEALWRFDRLEFHGQLSFIKGGLVFADRINTVSPTYAQEIQTEPFGHGLDGLLRHIGGRLSGILNGIDAREWNPGSDKQIAQRYNLRTLNKKGVNKVALQREFRLTPGEETPLLALIGRLVEQKGIDLLLAVLPELLQQPLQLVILGSGNRLLEQQLTELAARYPGRLAVAIGYDEGLAHRIEAGADIFLMPSRFEPCGLNQLYSLRYGTLPVVSPVGGLADTVVDADTPHGGSANGFVMAAVSAEALLATTRSALSCFHDKQRWRELQHNAMSEDFSWGKSAQAYRELYRLAQDDRDGERANGRV
ncbi:MAG: glycogen synthase GlgA [Gammaproteobacteria bacterium]|nr:glycogen synthase GlgA [Gammaproteobacteria bacterium]